MREGSDVDLYEDRDGNHKSSNYMIFGIVETDRDLQYHVIKTMWCQCLSKVVDLTSTRDIMKAFDLGSCLLNISVFSYKLY